MNILLIRLREIGDVVFTTPAIHALRQQFPGARLTYLVEPVAAPVVARNPHLDEVLVVPRHRGLRQIRDDVALAARLRAAAYDLVIDFHGGPRASWLARATGARRRIGYAVVGRSWLYTTRVARPRALRARHSVLNQGDLLEPLGIPPLDPVRQPAEMPEDPAVAAAVRQRLADAGITAAHRLVVVHVSAGNPFRRWPVQSFVDLIERLAAGGAARRIVLTAGPSDRDGAAHVARDALARLPAPRRAVLVRCGEFNLAELRSLVGRAALYIGGDSGPLHIAATTAVPIVALYGPTLAARSEPWRDPALVTENLDVGALPCRPCEQRHCVPGDFRCLTGLAAARVADAAERALARAAAGARSV